MEFHITIHISWNFANDVTQIKLQRKMNRNGLVRLSVTEK